MSPPLLGLPALHALEVLAVSPGDQLDLGPVLVSALPNLLAFLRQTKRDIRRSALHALAGLLKRKPEAVDDDTAAQVRTDNHYTMSVWPMCHSR